MHRFSHPFHLTVHSRKWAINLKINVKSWSITMITELWSTFQILILLIIHVTLLFLCLQYNLLSYALFSQTWGSNFSHILTAILTHSENWKIILDFHGALDTGDLFHKEINIDLYRLSQSQRRENIHINLATWC